MDAKYRIKEKSVLAFLEKHMLYQEFEFPKRQIGQIINVTFDRVNLAYDFMKDELLFKKDNGIEVGDKIIFEFPDETRRSGKDFKNFYTFKALEYDDMAILMKNVNLQTESVD